MKNFISSNRNWTVIKRHIPIVLKASCVALLSVILWVFGIHKYELSFVKEDENALLFIGLTFSSFAYAIFAGYAVNTVLQEYKEIAKAVIRNDVDTFLLYRDEQLPILVHLLVGTTSFFLVIFTLFFPYASVMSAALSNFSVSFLLTLVYYIVIELDDYTNSIWFKERIPKEWYKIDIQEHFKKK